MNEVNVFVKRALDEAASEHQETAAELRAWYSITKRARWTNFVELRANFPKADDVNGVIVFNIRHNRYRLLASVKYEREVDGRRLNGSVFIGKFMTHAEYDRWCALSTRNQQEALWPH